MSLHWDTLSWSRISCWGSGSQTNKDVFQPFDYECYGSLFQISINIKKSVFHHRVYSDTRGQYISHSCMGQTLEIVINSY